MDIKNDAVALAVLETGDRMYGLAVSAHSARGEGRPGRLRGLAQSGTVPRRTAARHPGCLRVPAGERGAHARAVQPAPERGDRTREQLSFTGSPRGSRHHPAFYYLEFRVVLLLHRWSVRVAIFNR